VIDSLAQFANFDERVAGRAALASQDGGVIPRIKRRHDRGLEVVGLLDVYGDTPLWRTYSNVSGHI
jgi:hypothetical protein